MQGRFESVEDASPKNGIVGVENVNNIKSDVIHVRVLWGDDPDWFNSFPTEAIKGLHRFLELFSVKTYLFKGCKEKDFGLAAIVN
jgi:hypothetical protein